MNKLTPHQQKALNYNNHISLTANAGSGKTFVLSKRFIEIAMKERIPLSKIVAITFTDKAASELYIKISDYIDELLSISLDNKERKKLENIRRQLISSNISTIHSFCLNLLREFPVEAELDANFIPIDVKLSSELIELSIEKVIKESLSNDDDERLKKLIRMFSSKRVLAGELKSLMKNFTKILFIEKNIYETTPENISGYYDKIIVEYFEKLIGNKFDQTIGYLITINQAVLEDNPDNELALKVLDKIESLNNILNVGQIIQTYSDIKNIICTKAGMVSIRGYLKKNLRSNIELQCCEVEFTFKNLEMFKNYGNERNILYELAVFGKEMLYFFRKCLNLYEEYKTENGFLDYEDILFKTYNILQNSNTREFLTEKYTYLMIDEYQDTNEIQYYIFLPLLDNLKKGNLFVVGDEKQSIYMFREAEPEVFQRTKVDISKISGQESILNLPDSFRMKPELCLFINEMFRKLFNNPDPLFNEVAPSDLICALKEDDPGKIEILFYNKDSKDENSESELVVKRIIKLISEGNGKYKWGDVAILCRKRKSFPELEKKLAEFNIPFLIMGGKEFYQRQSVYDIYNYFSFLLDNDNDTALVGLLRSPFFSFSDNDIYQISLEEGKSFWQKLKAFRRKYTKGEKTYNVLKENIHLVMDIDITLLMRKIFKESPFISVIAARPDGLQETANIEKLITLTTTFMREGYKTLYDYVNFIKVSIEEKDDEPQASLSENSETIKIMTLHQAKGLEFSIIVLYKCNEVTPINIVKTKSVIADKKLGLLTKIPIKENYYSLYQSSTINEISNFILGKKEFAEAKRLFYVGVTRVREQLIISFESNNELKLNYGSFIHMLKNALNVDLNQDTIKVEGDLTFLEDKNGICENNEKNLFLEIPIIKSFHLAASIVKDPDSIKEKKLEIASLLDEVSNEIISATKFSIFSQCPLRYYYQYELGFTSVNKGFIDIGREKISEKYRKDGSLKGRIIHSLLEEKFTGEDIYDKVKIKLENENIAITEKTNLINDIAEDLNNYYNSKTFKDIISAEYYQNEYELYIRENDFYLHGILDKVIFSDNRIKIIDYKTEVISPSEIESRREQYLSQLKFYAYIISRFFADIQSFELQIIFIKNPDIKVQFRLNKQDIISIKDEIVKMMESLKAWTFIKNMDFCSKCGYSFDKLKCIKEK